MTHAIVVGAGMTGLSTAWYLQEHGYDVEVIDKVGVAGGASWGNAGWLAPGKTIPLANSGLWSYGPTALLDKDAALSVPTRIDPKLWSFVAQFMARATQRAWDKTMAALTPIDKAALAAYDELVDGGVDAVTHKEPIIAGFENDKEVAGVIDEIAGVVRHGQDVPFEQLTRAEATRYASIFSEHVESFYKIGGQRFIEPQYFCQAIAEAVTARGGVITTGVEVTDVQSTRQPIVQLSTGEWKTADAVVIATGAWLSGLAKSLGVRTMVQAGRGYSFTVKPEAETKYPIYLPEKRVACTPAPTRGRFQIAGTMEFRGPDEPFQPRRIESIIDVTAPMFTGIDWDDIEDAWVGSRPVTPDGLPLIGRTQVPNVYTCGGHGMWGVVLGPISGKLLATQIATGETDPILTPFDPLR
ncbi:FAD-dependent oxidoreductase [Corynebacterium propinquum]|uniref:NAD(P)/FAD-dependent oxidoreductase n=1 Tax=Corynebacterium propinquum TaxID=43769 RepID=UPI002543A5B2|nr:FAD-dependent oxidoreductase [Corynebacterium propinquum]MDK4302359.1 FAD-dependent oxidoreductase [Corynebacterium propinquum]